MNLRLRLVQEKDAEMGNNTHAEGAYRLRNPGADEFEPIPNIPLVDECKGTRRNAVAVLFSCEHCSGAFEVIFRQHKGETHVSTRMVGTRARTQCSAPH